MVGKPGSDVCFDVEQLIKSFDRLSEEDVMIQLAGLAFHEHVHHFQRYSAEAIEQNEERANHLGGYVLITAKFVQLPVLRWLKPKSGPDLLQEIEALKATLKAKERAFLAPSQNDYAQYPDFQAKQDRGVIRLLPRSKFDEKLSLNGGGSYYSFANRSHEYGTGVDIEFSDENQLAAGNPAGADFGFFVDLGDVALSSLSAASPNLQFMLSFKPVNGDDAAIRQQQDIVYAGQLADSGTVYPQKIKNIHVGQTLGLRSVAFDESDIVVVLKIIRFDTDGSVILAWKKIRSFPIPRGTSP